MLSLKFRYAFIFSFAWALLIFVSKKALNLGARAVPLIIETAIVTLIILGLYIFIFKFKELKKVKLSHFYLLFFMGILETIACIADISGLKLSTSINYSFLIKSSFIFSITLAFLFLKEKIYKKKFYLMIVFIVGAYLVTTKGARLTPKIGDLLIVMAAFFYSSSSILQKPLLKTLSPNVVGWSRILFTLLVFSLASLFVGIEKPLLSDFSGTILPYIILAGVLTSFTTVYASKAISVGSISYLTMMSMTTPVMTSVLGILFLGENVNIYQLIGGTLIIGSVILVQKEKI